MWDFPLFPEQASSMAGKVDHLYFFLVGLTAFFSLLICGLVAYFAIKYRRGNVVNRANPIAPSMAMEAVWIGIPLVIVMVIFFWGAKIFFTNQRPPRQAQDIYVTGKQWMWKIQHLSGHREINELHLPVGQPVKLIMTSQDVIHSFYIPVFRVKQDVLPARTTQLWFEPTRPGTYHLFCAEYCGTQHSGMIGKVIVMEPDAYQRWLSGTNAGEPMSVVGERVFNQNGCMTCHMGEDKTRAPRLEGLYGKSVTLREGGTVTADEAYIAESILRPTAKTVAGYNPVMPTYQGRISEEELLQLVAYIKSLPAAGGSAPAATPAATATPAAPQSKEPAAAAADSNRPRSKSK